jgi:hypothetical protein
MYPHVNAALAGHVEMSVDAKGTQIREKPSRYRAFISLLGCLGMLLEESLAERQGFEPWIPCGIHAFQACAFSHSAISPLKATF